MTWLFIIAGLLLAWLVGGYLLQRKAIYPRWVIPIDRIPVADLGDHGETWRIELDGEDGGAVEAFYLPADSDAPGAAAPERQDGPPPGPAVIFAHGNAELIDYWPDLLEPYRRMGLAVLLVEYRGYGRADGTPTQAGIVADFAAAYDRLADRPEIDPRRIVFHGRSLGAGVACALGGERDAAALILQSAFTSMRAMLWRHGYPGFLARDPYDNLDAVRRFDGPVALFHGEQDNLIPPSHARSLAKAADDATLHVYEGVAHNDFPVHEPRFWRDVAGFLAGHGIIDAEAAEAIDGAASSAAEPDRPASWFR